MTLKVGCYHPGMNLVAVEEFAALVGRGQDLCHRFVGWDEDAPIGVCSELIAAGITPLVTFEPWVLDEGGDLVSAPTVGDIASGVHDAHLIAWVSQFASLGEVWMRFMHEMNGTWYPWGQPHEDNSFADATATLVNQVAAYNRFGAICRTYAPNLKLMWCPNAEGPDPATGDYDGEPHVAEFWPGGTHVDILGIDGYNLDTESVPYRSFAGIFSAAYEDVVALGAQPVCIAETSTRTNSTDGALWVKGAFMAMRSMERVESVLWFNSESQGYDVGSTPQLLESYRDQMAALDQAISVLRVEMTSGQTWETWEASWEEARRAFVPTPDEDDGALYGRSFNTGDMSAVSDVASVTGGSNQAIPVGDGDTAAVLQTFRVNEPTLLSEFHFTYGCSATVEAYLRDSSGGILATSTDDSHSVTVTSRELDFGSDWLPAGLYQIVLAAESTLTVASDPSSPYMGGAGYHLSPSGSWVAGDSVSPSTDFAFSVAGQTRECRISRADMLFEMPEFDGQIVDAILNIHGLYHENDGEVTHIVSGSTSPTGFGQQSFGAFPAELGWGYYERDVSALVSGDVHIGIVGDHDLRNSAPEDDTYHYSVFYGLHEDDLPPYLLISVLSGSPDIPSAGPVFDTPLWVLDRSERVAAALSNTSPQACPYSDDMHVERVDGYESLTFSVPTDHEDAAAITHKGIVLLSDLDSNTVPFRVQGIERDIIERVTTVECESLAQDELNSDPLRPVKFTDESASYIAGEILYGSRWTLGNVDWGGSGTLEFSWGDTRWGALVRTAEYFGLEIVKRAILKHGRLTDLYIDLVQSRGVETRKVLQYGKDITSATRSGRAHDVYTAAYGVGKSDAEGGFVSFAEEIWESPDDPVDKPVDTDWVGDPDALAVFGIPYGSGLKHRFTVFHDPDEDDAARLLARTWDHLQTVNHPQYTYECDVVSLERLGQSYSHERMRIGDGVMVRDLDYDETISWVQRVTEVHRCYSDITRDRVVIGIRRPIEAMTMEAARRLTRRVFSKEGIWSGGA